jgi:hypothetical protein
MNTWHAGRRWHTSDLHLVTTDEFHIDISAFAPYCHQALYRGLDEICVKCLHAGCDNLLRVGVCCKSHAIQVFLKETKEMGIIGSSTATPACDWLQRGGWEVTHRTLHSPYLEPGESRLFVGRFHPFYRPRRPLGRVEV